jgi:hypothetical protein
MSLSAANALQAKTGTSDQATASVVLDSGTQAGSTVVIEISSGGVSLMDGGMANIPPGFELDAILDVSGARYLHVFRKRDVAAGEGVAGSTSWDFSFITVSIWHWRVTEWDQGLEPVYPLDAAVSAGSFGATPATQSTGTTQTTGRSDHVCLAWHHWQKGGTGGQVYTFAWSAHTNGFTERAQLRHTFVGANISDIASSWSWLFDIGQGPYECTATITQDPADTSAAYVALLVVYAATTYA